jgi:hypothetical protein
VKAYVRRISKLTDERNELRDRLARVVEAGNGVVMASRNYLTPGMTAAVRAWDEALAAAKGEL